MFTTQLFSHLLRDFSLRFIDVAFIASKDHYEIVFVVIIYHLIDPEVDALEAFVVCDIIAYYCSSGISIV